MLVAAVLAAGCGTDSTGTPDSGLDGDWSCTELFGPGYCPSGLVCDTCGDTVDCNEPVDGDLDAACLGPCPAYGVWSLTLVSCGGLAVGDWAETWGGATMTLRADGDRCVAEVQTSGDCPLGERWVLDDVSADAVRVDEFCEAVCALPDGSVCDGETTRATGEVRLGAYGPEALGLLVQTVPTCTLDVRTFWSR